MADEWESLWKTINAFLLEVGSARDEREFNTVVSRLLSETIPVDYPCTLLYLGDEENVPVSLSGDSRLLTDFTAYYRYRLPFNEGYVRTHTSIDFDEFRDSEYVIDFLKPRGIRYVLGSYRGYVPNLLRSHCSPPFSDRECHIFHLLVPHLNRLYDFHRKISWLSRDTVRPSELAYNSRILSRREAEIVHLSSLRMTAREIASLLRISRRTVERHMANAYAKLGVFNRAGLLAKIYGTE